MPACVLSSPVGPIYICQTGAYITEIRTSQEMPFPPSTPLLHQAAAELQDYFAAKRQTFTLPLQPVGTPFQQAVWHQLTLIPYGETRTYGQIAAALGKPGASRAVGMANHCNPISIVIPCHRVIGANGRLVGYGGGLPMKRFLLTLEGVAVQQD